MLDRRMRWLTVRELEEIKRNDYHRWRVYAYRIMNLFPSAQVYIIKAPFMVMINHRLNKEPIDN